MGAGDEHRGPGGEIGAELLAAGEQVLGVVHAPGQDGAQEAGRRLLRGALGGADALDLGRDQRGDQAQQRAVGHLAAGAHAQLADRRVGDLEVQRDDVLALAHERALVGGGAGRDGEHARRTVDQDEAGVERPRGVAQDLREPGPRLDGVGDRAEGAEIGHSVHHGSDVVDRVRTISAIPG